MGKISRQHHTDIPATGLLKTLWIFGGAGILLYLVIRWVIPYLHPFTGIPPIFLWFLTGGLFVFLPLLIAAVILLRKENAWESWKSIWSRLNFKKLRPGDWLGVIVALVAIGGLTMLLQYLMHLFLGEINLHPSFMSIEEVQLSRVVMIIMWLPFWLLNIMGEELLWRGVLLPRQERWFGNYAWVANGTGWLIFHIAFGWQIMLLLSPILFILPYTTQKTGNTWVAVIIHALFNGSGFLAVLFEIV